MKVFLAFSFRIEDKPLVSYIEQLLASQYVHVITGERLGGEQLTPKVKARIEEADALVGLLTRRDALANNAGWTTHDWVKDEIGHARSKGKHAIALVEQGVTLGGMNDPHEHIPFTREDLIETMLVLSETVGLWKREVGRTVKVQIMPADVAQKLGANGQGVKCQHRLCLNGKFTEWRDSIPVPEVGGTFVYLEGVQDEQMVQIRVQEPDKVWMSPATPQSLQVWLDNGGNKP